ncbi:TetR/AcrR family transcriptional regulator [Phytohabitans aurantiacus]|jgi:AcrR family transcriptional regulator|uniref:TetR family transcriptional regulator n=1 Tax=Phytohabitans aurantiacus TaxID=3016789 RepID=A0ABQ5R9K4_9ACTN|nr:TetR/AcrR family transcriptional regulator [Phytohabitans aurantiacus]GLI02577.1 TetR family transcriptional regulator [Phytohabitans aurantiacus]
MAGPELPVSGQEQPERADAARNRQRILCAAAELIAAQGAQAVTMNAVAHRAGIGVGTVYRRFGDVSKLLFALLDESEKRFQAAFLTGPPPLGPGAPPAERLRAFLHALADHVIDQCEIMRVAEKASPIARYHGGPYLTMHTHVSVLLREARPDRDPAVLAHLLLAPFVSSLFDHLTVDRRLTADEIKAAIDGLLPV